MEFPYRNPRYGDPEKVLHYSSVTHKLAFLKFLDHIEKYLSTYINLKKKPIAIDRIGFVIKLRKINQN